MKKTILVATAASLSLLAAPAFAQAVVTGDVTVTGQVTSMCTVVEGSATSQSFTDTIALGELAGADGLLKAGLQGASVSGAEAEFRVHCTAAGASIEVDAEALENEDVADAPANYARAIDYTADLVASLAGGGSETVSDGTANPDATTEVLTAAYLANQDDNIVVKVHSLATVGGATQVLTAGDYVGHVKVKITPAT